MLNDYERKQQERKERLEQRAALCARLAEIRHDRARQMASVIPFGQPILVGHHSEHRDRRYRDKIHRNFQKAMELQKKADYYKQKALSVGHAGISSDDPEAVVKIQEKITKAELLQARMVAANKAVRKNDRAALAIQGFKEGQINDLFTPDYCGRLGFADYELQNNSANIRRMKQRVDQLRSEHGQRTADESPVLAIVAPTGVSIVENAGLNRLQILFPGKPAEAIRSRLKANGFRWSPTEGAWQRQLNNAARYAAKHVLEGL